MAAPKAEVTQTNKVNHVWDEGVNMIPIIPVSGRWDGWMIDIRRTIRQNDDGKYHHGFIMTSPDYTQYGWAEECELGDRYTNVYEKLMKVLNGPIPPEGIESSETS